MLFYRVEFYSKAGLEHNATVSTLEELAAVANGRSVVFTSMADEAEYKSDQNQIALCKDAVTRFANLVKEFPDFDLSSLPEIPAAWEDISWRNDSCPCFEIWKDETSGNRLYLFVDYSDPEQREMPESEHRFSLHLETYENGECDCATLTDTNDFQTVLEIVAARSIETA